MSVIEDPKCECGFTDEKYWFSHYGAVEPGSQMEPNPDCRVHFPRGLLWEMIGKALMGERQFEKMKRSM